MEGLDPLFSNKQFSSKKNVVHEDIAPQNPSVFSVTLNNAQSKVGARNKIALSSYPQLSSQAKKSALKTPLLTHAEKNTALKRRAIDNSEALEKDNKSFSDIKNERDKSVVTNKFKLEKQSKTVNACDDNAAGSANTEGASNKISELSQNDSTLNVTDSSKETDLDKLDNELVLDNQSDSSSGALSDVTPSLISSMGFLQNTGTGLDSGQDKVDGTATNATQLESVSSSTINSNSVLSIIDQENKSLSSETVHSSNSSFFLAQVQSGELNNDPDDLNNAGINSESQNNKTTLLRSLSEADGVVSDTPDTNVFLNAAIKNNENSSELSHKTSSLEKNSISVDTYINNSNNNSTSQQQVSSNPSSIYLGMAQQAPPVILQSQQAANAAASLLLNLPTPVTHSSWGGHVADKMIILGSQGIQSAEMILSPPDMGTMHAKITIENGKMELTFMSDSPIVRHALEANIPLLKETLQNSNVSLSNVVVSDYSDAKQQETLQQFYRQSPSRIATSNDNEQPAILNDVKTVTSSNKTIDYYT